MLIPATRASQPNPTRSCPYQPQKQNCPVLLVRAYYASHKSTIPSPINISVHAYFTSHKRPELPNHISSCLLYQPQGQNYPILSLYQFMLTLPVTRAELPNHITVSLHAYFTSHKGRTAQSYQFMLIIPATRAELPNPIRLCLLYQPQDQNYPQLMFNVYLP